MNILKIWTKIQIFWKFGIKNDIFENFVPYSGFSKISKKTGIFEYFDQTQDF